jgi:hypothetical protein
MALNLENLQSRIANLQKQVDGLKTNISGQGNVVLSQARLTVDRSVSISELMNKIRSIEIFSWDGIIPGSNGLLRLYSDNYGRSVKLQRRKELRDKWKDTGNEWA